MFEIMHDFRTDPISTPLLFKDGPATYVPAESVYAVFEVKPTLDAGHVEYAGEKAGSVRRLRRTSAPIPHAGGRYGPKKPHRILAGVLTPESGWNPPLGTALRSALKKLPTHERLDLGGALRDGSFEATYRGKELSLATSDSDTALVFFFLRLLGRLQAVGTVPALDFRKYSESL